MENKIYEKEANLFACLLLMPKEMIKKDVENGLDLGDDKALKGLAKKYQVPLNAMVYRLSLYISKNI